MWWSAVLHPPKWRTSCRMAQPGPNNVLEQSEVWNTINRWQVAIIVKECMNDWNHSINNGNEDHYLNFIPISCFADISRIFICPHSVVFLMWFLMEAKKLLVSPNDSIDNVGWLLQYPLTKLPSLCFVDEAKFVSDDPPKRGFGGWNLLRSFSERANGVSSKKLFTSWITASVLFGFVFICFFLWMEPVSLKRWQTLVNFFRW